MNAHSYSEALAILQKLDQEGRLPVQQKGGIGEIAALLPTVATKTPAP